MNEKRITMRRGGASAYRINEKSDGKLNVTILQFRDHFYVHRPTGNKKKNI